MKKRVDKLDCMRAQLPGYPLNGRELEGSLKYLFYIPTPPLVPH